MPKLDFETKFGWGELVSVLTLLMCVAGFGINAYVNTNVQTYNLTNVVDDVKLLKKDIKDLDGSVHVLIGEINQLNQDKLSDHKHASNGYQ